MRDSGLTAEVVGLIVVAQRDLHIIDQPLSDLCFTTEYDIRGPLNSPQNFIASLLNRVLGDYCALKAMFDDQKYRKVFTLPFRNFKAADLTDLRQICVNSIDNPGFAVRMEGALKSLRKRQRPKRYEDSNVRYLIDDEGKHFNFGHEVHAQADTKMPPHNRLCVLQNQFRFGRRFDNRHHYNVSSGDRNGKMDGTHPNCHDAPTITQGHTHLNMFPNDFF